jgi:hypothetical protein
MGHGSIVRGTAPLQLLSRLRNRVPRLSVVSWALVVITLAGFLLRLYLELSYRPALLGFPDSLSYIIDAQYGLFTAPGRVSGYAIFLQGLHAISAHLMLVTSVQHLLGIASGLLLFDAVRRVGCPPALGLIPAAVVILGGSQIILEHAILSDLLFLFLTTLALWFVVRTWTGSGWWALGVGLALGAATIVREVGLELLPFALLSLLLVPRAAARIRVAVLAAGVAGAAAVIVPFGYDHKVETGSWGFASTSAFQLYGRVAPWADCSKFTPPKGTAKLCIHTPVSQRRGSQEWLFTRASPAVVAYGTPDSNTHPPSDENSHLESFAWAAITGQPLTYLHYVSRDLVRVVDPSFPSSPYSGIGNSLAGLTPDEMRNSMFNTDRLLPNAQVVTSYYDSPTLVAGDVQLIKTWDRDTRLEGPAMVLVLLLALLAPILARGLPRRLALLCAIYAAVLIVGPILTLEYDWRFMIPAFGPLTAGAAIGGFEVVTRLVHVARAARARRRSGDSAPPRQAAPPAG